MISKTNIVVTCWNAFPYTKVTLERLFATVHNDYCLTIIDNASSDETPEYLKDLRPPSNCKKLTLITNEQNEGNVGAVNQGYEVSKQLGATYTCLCNNDLYFQDGWFKRLEETMDKNSKLGMLGSLRPAISVKHYNGKPTSVVLKSTPEEYDLREELKFFMGEPIEQFDAAAEKIIAVNGRGLAILPVPPEALSSYCVFVRNVAAEDVGYMADPQFSPYGSDDIDLTWAIAQAGYQCAMLKDTYVHHFRSKSIKANGANQNKLLFDNNQKFFRKWKSVIHDFLLSEQTKGVNLAEMLGEEKDNDYWFLFRLNGNIGFWDGQNLIGFEDKDAIPKQ